MRILLYKCLPSMDKYLNLWSRYAYYLALFCLKIAFLANLHTSLRKVFQSADIELTGNLLLLLAGADVAIEEELLDIKYL